MAFTVLVGVIGGLAIALIAGARRSASVVERYFAAGTPYDLQVGTSLTRAELLDLPEVVRADPSAYVAMVRVAPDGGIGDGINSVVADWSAIDPTIRVLDGAVPDGTDPYEVVVNEAFVALYDRAVGDSVDVRMFGTDQRAQLDVGDYRATGPGYTFRIAAVVRMPDDIAVDEVKSTSGSAYGSTTSMLVSQQFYEEHRDEFLDFGAAYDIQLTDVVHAREDFVATVERHAGEREESPLFGPQRLRERQAGLQSPVELESNALRLLGTGIALAGAATLTLLLRAERRSHEHDEPTLRALGYTSRQLGAVALLRTAPVAIGGAVTAIGVAVAVSPRFPVGIGRQLELDGGLDVDVAVVAVGGATIALFVGGLSYLLGHAPLRRGLPRPRRTLAGRLASAGGPTEVVIGTQLAFGGGSRSGAAQSRGGVIGGAVAVAIVAGVGIYVAGVDHLYSVPVARGWAWDAVIGNANFSLSEATVDKLADDPRIEAQTVARVCGASVGDEQTGVLAVRPGGTAPPVLGSGRLPASASEIALGARLARDLDAGVGDLVEFSVAGGDCRQAEKANDIDLTVVGIGIVLPPTLGDTNLGEGAVVTLDALVAAGGDDEPQFVMTKFSGDAVGVDGAAVDRYVTEEIVTDAIPAEVVNLRRVRDLPLIGLLLAGAMGTIILAYTLAVGQRGQMRDLAVLRTIGLSSPQLRRVMAWQGVVLAGAMVLVGLPVGVAVGVSVWGRFADDLGVAAGPITPWLLLLPLLCVMVAIVATLHPARRARQASVSALLRSE